MSSTLPRNQLISHVYSLLQCYPPLRLVPNNLIRQRLDQSYHPFQEFLSGKYLENERQRVYPPSSQYKLTSSGSLKFQILRTSTRMRVMQSTNRRSLKKTLSPRFSQYSAIMVSAVINLDIKDRTCSSGLR